MIVQLKKMVTHVLEIDEQSRNSDVRLTQMVWWNYYNSKVFEVEREIDGKKVMKKATLLSDFFELPREDQVSRMRRKIQEEAFDRVVNKGILSAKIYLPTDEKVVKQRRMNEEKWRAFMSESFNLFSK